MKTSITLICHGATADNRASAFPADEPLEPKAVERTLLMRGVLPAGDRALASPSLRTLQTAELLGLAVIKEAEIRECDYGHWSGKSLQQIGEQDPDGLSLWIADVNAAPHGGESLSGLLKRVGRWLDGCIDQGGHTLVVTHVSIIRACLLHILQAPAASFWKIDVEPLSLTRLTSDGRRWTLRVPSIRD